MEQLVTDMIDWIWPRPSGCPVCGRRISEYAVCRICRLVYRNRRCCSQCGRAVGHSGRCSDCLQRLFRFDGAQAIGVLYGKLHDAILRFKYEHEACLVQPLAAWLAAETRLPRPDLLSFVPPDPYRQLRRGYNTSELLAVELGRLLDVPCSPLLERARGKRPPQEGADYTTRWRQTVALYMASRSLQLTSRVVWLVDDVLTTGATMSACALALKELGVERVYGLAVAATPARRAVRSLQPEPAREVIDVQRTWL